MSDIVCSFFGHRNVEITEELKEKVKDVVEDLIVKHNVLTFLFGSNSNFNYLCHLVVTELKEKYKNIKRIAYTRRSETCTLENERQKWEEILSNLHKEKIFLLGVEEEFEHKTKYTSGKASYISRNQAMINNSNYCVFYYNEFYKPQKRKHSKKSLSYYQPKSGTKLAFIYAKQKNKIIINLFK